MNRRLLEGLSELNVFRQAVMAGNRTRTKLPKNLMANARDRLAGVLRTTKARLRGEPSTALLPEHIAQKRVRSIKDLGNSLGNNKGMIAAVKADKGLGSSIRRYIIDRIKGG